MWCTRAACVVLLALIGVTVGWELRGLSSFTVPVFMWSDKQIFSKTQVLDTVSPVDVEYALASLLHKNTNKNSKLSTSFNGDASTAEVVILFVEPELRTDQVPYIASAYASTPGGSFSHLKNAIETATSSLSMPYTTVEHVSLFDSIIDDVVDQVDGKIFLSAVDGSDVFSRLKRQIGVTSVPIDALMETLVEARVFDNEKTDFVIVSFNRGGQMFEAHDDIVGSLTNSIAAKGNYVAVYAANKPVKEEFVWTFESHSHSEFKRNIELYMYENGTTPNGTMPTNSTGSSVNYFPGPFLEALLVCIILITMLFTGACAIFGLQTPDKWEAPKAKREL